MKTILRKVFVGVTGLCCMTLVSCVTTQGNYNYAMINSPEEAGMIFTRITPEKATVLAHEEFIGNMLSLDKDKQKLVYLSKVENDQNLYLLDLSSPNVSQQRTFRNDVVGGFSISPLSDEIAFCSGSEILTTSVNAGSICKQITSNNRDYAPAFTPDGSKIFFNRISINQYSTMSNIWSYDMTNKEMSMYGEGFCPTPSVDNMVYILKTAKKEGVEYVEIRRVNYNTGANDVILSNENYRPRSLSVSPDGKWLMFSAQQYVGRKWNVAQIYIMRTDGTELSQITYHKGGNYSPIWGDGSSIYFISGRGDKDRRFGIWKTTGIIK